MNQAYVPSKGLGLSCFISSNPHWVLWSLCTDEETEAVRVEDSPEVAGLTLQAVWEPNLSLHPLDGSEWTTSLRMGQLSLALVLQVGTKLLSSLEFPLNTWPALTKTQNKTTGDSSNRARVLSVNCYTLVGPHPPPIYVDQLMTMYNVTELVTQCRPTFHEGSLGA